MFLSNVSAETITWRIWHSSVTKFTFIAVPTLALFEVFAVQHPLVRSRLGFINVLIKSSPFTVFLSRIDLLQSFFNEILLVVTKRIRFLMLTRARTKILGRRRYFNSLQSGCARRLEALLS